MKMSLKVLVDKESNKVVYGEAGKDLVDYLVGLMEIPLGCILRHSSAKSKYGILPLANVYKSFQSLDKSYLQNPEVRTSILNPQFVSTSNVVQTPLLQTFVKSNSSYGSSSSKKQEAVNGYVKGAVTFIVTDDLTITPSTTIDSINLLNTKGIKDMGALQEVTFQIDGTKAMELVRASFQSSTVPTDVFVPPSTFAVALYKLSLKVLMDKESKKVVYGEAGKEFVDFLFGLMEIPLGRILSLLPKSGSLPLAKVYQSFGSLEQSYLEKPEVRTSILNPKFVSDSSVVQTPVLQGLIKRESNSIYGSSSSKKQKEVNGYVKGAVNYIIMDDLTITPSSTITSINLLNTKGIKDMSSLQLMTFQIDGTKALELVRASFQSKTVLTDVFVTPATITNAAKKQRS